MDFSKLWKHCYRFTHAYFHTVNYLSFRYQQSLSRCIAVHAKMSVFNGYMLRNAFYHWNKPFKICYHSYCCAIKTNDKTVCLPVPQPASAGKEQTRVNCKLITVWNQNSHLALVQCECHTCK